MHCLRYRSELKNYTITNSGIQQKEMQYKNNKNGLIKKNKEIYWD